MKLTPKLTRKQQAFVNHIIENPKDSATEAAAQTYKVRTRHTAEQIASENLRKPEIVTALAAHTELAENTIVNTINEYRNSDKQWERTLANENSKWVHDKIHGKATQKIESTSVSLVFGMDLGSTTGEN